MKLYLAQLIVLSILICVLAISCDKVYNCDGSNKLAFRFKLPVTITPQKDTFQIGDTIWIENSFDDQIFNHDNQKTYSVRDFDFMTTMGITDLNSPSPAKSYRQPKIITLEGETSGDYIESSDYQTLYIKYDYSERRYKYKVAFIPDKAGFYFLGFSSFADSKRTDITECKHETLFVEYVANDATDNNYELVKKAKDPFFHNKTREEFDKGGSYCFYVKE